eukprot:symbB.v1.2.025803.t1/scaffold2528.1/size92917/4
MKWFPHLQRFGFTFYFLEVVSSGADEDLEEELPMIFGIGLARRIALMNHSCRPNCEIDYDGNGTAIVTALRQIRPKEELTISYIDETKPLGVRRRVLARRYGFKCFCRRCVHELCRQRPCFWRFGKQKTAKKEASTSNIWNKEIN